MTGKPARQRHAEFVARQIAKGLKLVRVWVKIKNARKLIEYAKTLK